MSITLCLTGITLCQRRIKVDVDHAVLLPSRRVNGGLTWITIRLCLTGITLCQWRIKVDLGHALFHCHHAVSTADENGSRSRCV